MANPELTEYERNSLQKPYKGQARDERMEKRADIEAAEEKNKREVRRLDGYMCRVPHCDCLKRRDRLEVAHLVDKGIGGDHGVRSGLENLILLCLAHHQGRVSLHQGTLKIEPLTPEGMRGPCEFWVSDGGSGWVSIGREEAVGVLVHD